jgi:hypothetical protein
MWILGNATSKKMSYIVGGQQLELLPGQIIIGRKRLAEELGMSEQSTRTCLKLLKNFGNLTIKSTNKYSVLTVVNWESYQSGSSKLTNKPTSNQPATNQQLTTKQEYKNIKNIKNTNYTSDFLSFWESYPKKTGKGAAFNSWKRIPKTNGLIEQITAALERHRQCEQWQRDNGQYIPNPATWLNQRRWEDELSGMVNPATLKTTDDIALEKWNKWRKK